MAIQRIHYFQHVPFEGLSMIEQWTKLHNYQLSSTKFFQDSYTIPSPSDYDALIILGGPMGVYDNSSWFEQEKKHIKEAICADKHILGICLGAQLLANALGAKVAPHTHQEIGYFPINLKLEHPILSHLGKHISPLHWHRDRFEIPEGAIHLASSDACDNQAFLYKERILGLQFHLEMDKKARIQIIKNCSLPKQTSQYIQSEDQILNNQPSSQEALYTLLNNWLKL